MQSHDVIISGGGMVGATLACALSGHGLRIAVIEAGNREVRESAGFDDRSIALAWGTRRIFEGLDLWDALEPQATAIHGIHVSDRGHPFTVQLDRESEGLPAVGYVVPARVIAQVLDAAMDRLDDVTICSPAQVVTSAADDSRVRVDLDMDGARQHLDGALLVAADGADSALRRHAGIAAEQIEYDQVAIVTNIRTQLPHDNIAYERFTRSGPLAVLPMSEGRCGVVWTVDSEAADAVMALDDATFLQQLQTQFGQRLGRIERVGRRQAWPLRLVSAADTAAGRLALVGNAVHTLHPVAGQGFNLGARDAAVLAELVVEAQRSGTDPGADALLSEYRGWRARDHRNVTRFTDGLVRLFGSTLPGAGLVRGAGMLLLDRLPPARRLLTRLTMGRSGRTPRLSRGLPL